MFWFISSPNIVTASADQWVHSYLRAAHQTLGAPHLDQGPKPEYPTSAFSTLNFSIRLLHQKRRNSPFAPAVRALMVRRPAIRTTFRRCNQLSFLKSSHSRRSLCTIPRNVTFCLQQRMARLKQTCLQSDQIVLVARLSDSIRLRERRGWTTTLNLRFTVRNHKNSFCFLVQSGIDLQIMQQFQIISCCLP